MRPSLIRIFALSWLVFSSGCAGYGDNTSKSVSFPVKQGHASLSPTGSLQSYTGWEGVKPKVNQETLELYVNSFTHLMFHTEMQGVFPYIRKYNRPVRIWFIGAESENLIPMALTLEKPLELVSGLSFGLAPNLSESNLLVSFSNKGSSETHCITDRILNSDGSIFRSVIYIGPKYSRHPLSHCLTEEISQSYGPSNDVDIVKESLWRPMEGGKETNLGLTWHDAIILRTLYDERLKPGMHRDQAMPLVRQIIREVLEDINR